MYPFRDHEAHKHGPYVQFMFVKQMIRMQLMVQGAPSYPAFSAIMAAAFPLKTVNIASSQKRERGGCSSNGY